ncbi:hypothetical protein [Phaeocystidibacter luteus]|uniref:Aromatic hydrocarbon degradation protein n=1 Tax=Phaeocystidibacter luteus TaxID=911197 RepID=A0A6N6RGU8_9FLAO|nr:hypothetical protein [Phaeocystidibacter luteus]KAB2809973.1 hypothetical protein F8C67_08825 [Phaeocystidibacter luteus]
MKYLHLGVTISALFLSIASFAQGEFNQNLMPLGDVESLIGNTGTGGVNSTGAVYYNPAALTDLHGTNFSFSGNAYFSFEFKSDPFVTIQGEELDFEGSAYRSLPSSLISTKTWGDWAVAFSLLIPNSFNIEGKEFWQLQNAGNPLNIQAQHNFSEDYFLAGFSAARRLGNGWSVGGTLTGQYYYYMNTVGINIYAVNDPSIVSIGSYRQTLESYSLYLNVGILKRWEKFSVGLRVTTPSIRLGGTGDYYAFTYSSGNPSQEIDIIDATAHKVNPVDFRLGFTYKFNEKWLWALDGAYTLETEHNYYDGQAPIDETSPSNLRISSGVTGSVKDGRDIYFGMSYNPYRATLNGREVTQSLVSITGGSRIKIGKSLNSIGIFYAIAGLESEFFGEDLGGVSEQTYFGISVGTTVLLDD